ncbi:death-associated inhibitor of apoptosis 1-like [Ylistrum balloti]|uniref:death-associated inhibitor of apoptosis 1-like n=1 Tax=Ylistrum balloti TaxID=509963 RepID=UPI002905B1A5|nr:death-associated inhibitor of apoptosis 1-like [Ylistrum balloti]
MAKKPASHRHRCKSFSKRTKPEERESLNSESSVFKHCLVYRQKVWNLWYKHSLLSMNYRNTITSIVVSIIIACSLYDMRLVHLLSHFSIIIVLLMDVRNFNFTLKFNKVVAYEGTKNTYSIENVKYKPHSFWNLKDNLSWLRQFEPHKVCLDVFPSSLNFYFQNSENGDASESMNIEWLRLRSFSADRNISVRPIRLARAGFYYTGTSDEVRCFSCGIQRSNWMAGEDPAEIHKRISPLCRHVNGTDNRNIAISRESDHTNSSRATVTASPRESDHASSSRATVTASSREGDHTNSSCATVTASPRESDHASSSRATVTASSRESDHASSSRATVTASSRESDHACSRAMMASFENQGMFVGSHEKKKPSTINVNRKYVVNSQLAGRAGRDMETQQENPSIEQRTGKTKPHSHGQRSDHRNVIQNVLSLEQEQTRISNGHEDANTSITPQVSANRSSATEQPHRSSANNRHRHNISSSGSGAVSDSVVQKLAPLGVVFDKPKYPAYAVLTVRMSSYSGWPCSQTQSLMAEAGFVYAGYADYTRCFFCGGGLRNWIDGDDPWVEHARWFPRCAYLRQSKGLDFIRLVHENLDDENQAHGSISDNVQGKKCENPTENLPSDKEVAELPAFQSVVQQGYSADQATQVIRKLWTKGITDVHSTDILTEILRINDDDGDEDDPEMKNTDYGGIRNTSNDDVEEHEIRRLEEENRRLQKEKLCRICEEEDASIAFLPCAHLVCCHVCAQAVRRCPVCNVITQGTIKTWFT